MPSREDGKTPLLPHKNNAYTPDMFKPYQCDKGAIILLGKSLIVVDVDNLEWCGRLEALFPNSFPQTVICKGKKGKHYYFCRTPNASHIMDSPGKLREMKENQETRKMEEVKIPIDVKTLCSTGTRGVISIPPSPNKKWEKELGVHKPLPIPDEFIDFYNKHMSRSTTKNRTKKTKQMEDLAALNHPIANNSSGTDYVTKLLNLLSKTRWDDRNQWRDIAIALQNHTNDEQYYNVWLELSKVSRKFDQAEAEKLWNSCVDPNYEGARLTLGTIEHWASQDDPVGYSVLKGFQVSQQYEKWIFEDEDRGLGLLAADVLKDVVKRVSIGEIYYFNPETVLWQEVSMNNLHRPVSFAIEKEIDKLVVKYSHLVANTHDEKEKEKLQEKLSFLHKRKKYIKRTAGMHNVTREGFSEVQDQDFKKNLDQYPYLLGVKNGVIDLRTGELRDRSPEDCVFRVLAYDYDPTVSTDFIESTVLSIMADDPQMARFLQHFLGYAITGDVQEDLFVVFTSPGRNGKGVITEAIQELLGPFYSAINSGIIIDKQVSNIDSQWHLLEGKRIITVGETNPGDVLNLANVKIISGGDPIVARPLYGNPVTFNPRHQCILVTNDLPNITKVDEASRAIIDRMMVIKFPVNYVNLEPGQEPTATLKQIDRTLKKRFKEQKQEFLKWLVQGAVHWYQTQNLRGEAPPQVHEFSRKYLRGEDVLAAFIEEMCVIEDGAMVSTSNFFHAFQAWAGRTHYKQQTLPAAVMQKYPNVEKKLARINNSPPCQCYINIRLLTNDTNWF
jgi:putative DNA primase/helicase